MKLSILICTLPQREVMFGELRSKLMGQLFELVDFKDQVEIRSASSIKMTTGALRNDLLKMAKGDFVVFIDDDDDVDADYIKEILTVINANPHIDCVGINGVISFDGEKSKRWSISIKHGHWHETDEMYFRTPNHISPVRRSIALQAKFPDISYGEDMEYSKRIFPMLKNEVCIEKPLYHYKYVTKK
jgi:glycosyltransferase involved in cell wall biosynthesis